METYKVTIEIFVTAENDTDAYNKACKDISASQLSRESCIIEVEDD